jgi:pimeloyl-ACP methyl ester carboxylesterase
MVRKLQAAPVSIAGVTPDAYLALRDRAMHSLRIGTTRDIRSVVSGIVVPSLRSLNTPLARKSNCGGEGSRLALVLFGARCWLPAWSKILTEVALPTYFLHGIYDYTCSYTLAKNYFNRLKAPLKGFYTFERSAHSPIFEEPEKARKILREDVLAGANDLADEALT